MRGDHSKTYYVESGSLHRRILAGTLRSAVKRALTLAPPSNLGLLIRAREVPHGVWHYLDPRAFITIAEPPAVNNRPRRDDESVSDYIVSLVTEHEGKREAR